MYYPYLRGKQYELIMLRENAQLIADAGIHPIIEPVRADMSAVRRALDALGTAGATCTVIVNPGVGQLREQGDRLLDELFVDRPETWRDVDAGYIMQADSGIDDLVSRAEANPDTGIVVVHGGFADGRNLAAATSSLDNVTRHVFIDGLVGKLYMGHFAGQGLERVLVRDGFKQQSKNAQYPLSDHFSDLHVTYVDEGVDGFGDFLTVGATYTESGGPAYAVAVHMTYLDVESDMQTFHFVSDQTDSPTDPGGKFLEALRKLTVEATREGTPLLRTAACGEFMELYEQGGYRGLGYAKKLSMQHHVELMASVLRGEQ